MTNKEKKKAILDLGWGRLIFSNTFTKSQDLANEINKEKPGKKDLIIYNENPHLVLSKSPQEIFLDPSHFYRLNLEKYSKKYREPRGFSVRKIRENEADEFIYISKTRLMSKPPKNFIKKHVNSKTISYFAAFDDTTGKIIGIVTAIDHKEAFNDPKNGASFWSLAVDPQASFPGIGIALVTYMIEYYKKKGKKYLDLSVMHGNAEAIALYEKIGFKKIKGFCLKRKNPLNEHLFVGPEMNEKINIYAGIIIDEARKRGIQVEIIDKQESFFSMSFGGKTVQCRESLSDYTSSIAMSICQDKRVTQRFLNKQDFSVPRQILAGSKKSNENFLKKHKRVVVKASSEEGGNGIFVNITDPKELEKAIKKAENVSERVLLEEFVKGKDIRVLIVNFEAIAAGKRTPATIIGTGQHTIKQLIQKLARRRYSATQGGVNVKIDGETKRCIAQKGYKLDDVLQLKKRLQIRNTANIHTGGTITDVTRKVNPEIKKMAEEIAKAINIPVCGVDFIVPNLSGTKHWIIEVNERPDLTIHHPWPAAEKFVDFLFPQTKIINK